MSHAIGYAAKDSASPLALIRFERAEPKENEIEIDILYCGVCHSDLHQARNEWKNTIYPCLPGHEIIGRVSRVGAGVRRFKAGDLAGVGCMVDSCQTCPNCEEGLEQYCDKGATLTYNGPMTPDGSNTFGGYANLIVLREDFALHIPEKLDPRSAAPLLCAGITTYSPLRHWKIGKGHKVGVIGLGGLGHMAIQFASAMGAEVTLITTSPGKEHDAKKLGAKDALLSNDKEAMKKQAGRFDYILNTIPNEHDVMPYIALLKRDGMLTIVGCVVPLSSAPDMSQFIFKRRSLSGSLIGGIAETQEMLDFCAEKNIKPLIEMIPIQQINEAYDRMVKGDVHYRFVIDMASLKEEMKAA